MSIKLSIKELNASDSNFTYLPTVTLQFLPNPKWLPAHNTCFLHTVMCTTYLVHYLAQLNITSDTDA